MLSFPRNHDDSFHCCHSRESGNPVFIAMVSCPGILDTRLRECDKRRDLIQNITLSFPHTHNATSRCHSRALMTRHHAVIPAKAGIQYSWRRFRVPVFWTPAYASVTDGETSSKTPRCHSHALMTQQHSVIPTHCHSRESGNPS